MFVALNFDSFLFCASHKSSILRIKSSKPLSLVRCTYMHNMAWHGMACIAPMSMRLFHSNFMSNTNTCAALHIVAIESRWSFLFSEQKILFLHQHIRNQPSYVSCICVRILLHACIAHMQPQPHWWWLCKCLSERFLACSIYTPFFIDCRSFGKIQATNRGREDAHVVCCAVRAHCNSSFHFRISTSFAQCLETIRFTTATVISQ